MRAHRRRTMGKPRKLPVGAIEHVGQLEHEDGVDEVQPAVPESEPDHRPDEREERKERDLVGRETGLCKRNHQRGGERTRDEPIPQDVPRLLRLAVDLCGFREEAH